MNWKRKDFPQWDGESKGQKTYKVIDGSNQIYKAKRTLFNDSGWCEIGTNKQIRPTGWKVI